jgi:ZIP family zinc transporter
VFYYSFLSGLSEPIGALVGYLFLHRFLSGIVFGLLFAAVAGIMVFISLDELLLTAEKYGEHHIAIYGVIAGMITMATSLLLFVYCSRSQTHQVKIVRKRGTIISL